MKLLVLTLTLLVVTGCAPSTETTSGAATSRQVHACAYSAGSGPTTVPTRVADAVYVLSIAGGNVVVSRGTDGLVVVDPRVPAVAEVLEAFSPDTPRTVIDTHSHRDHTSGNGAVVRAPGEIFAHDAVKARLVVPQIFKGSPVAVAPAVDWPTRTYSDRLQLHLNGDDIELVHPAGAHTDGDTVVIFSKAHVVAMGDIFFPDRFPYVDPDAGGRVDALVVAIDGFVRAWPEDMRIIPGHGRSVCTMVDLRKYQTMLHDSLYWIGAGRRAGLSLDRMLVRGAPAAYKGWAWPLVDEKLWVSLVASSGGV